MSHIRSVAINAHFGAGLVIQGLELTSASSTIVPPSDSDTIFKVKRGDFLVDLHIVTTGGKVFIRLPFSHFQQVSAAQAGEIPDLAGLLNPQTGLAALLPSGSDVTYLASESIGGVDTYKIAATYGGAELGRFLGSLAPGASVRATLWIDQGDHLVRRAELSGRFAGSKQPVGLTIDFHDYDREVTITPPPVPTPSPAVSGGAGSGAAAPSPTP